MKLPSCDTHESETKRLLHAQFNLLKPSGNFTYDQV
jgi:hypothetical protein